MSRARQRSRRSVRFPRYAPELLESRLNPSSVAMTADLAPAPPPDLLMSPVDVGDPPVEPVAAPVGPAGPAACEVGDPPVIPVTVPIGPAVPA